METAPLLSHSEFLRRLDSTIPVCRQAITDVTKLCVRESEGKYRFLKDIFVCKNTSVNNV